MTFPEAVYETLSGIAGPEYSVPGVENMYADGSDCLQLYEQMRVAYDRVLARLDLMDEDPDIEEMILLMEKMQQRMCLRMYEIGQLIGARYNLPPY